MRLSLVLLLMIVMLSNPAASGSSSDGPEAIERYLSGELGMNFLVIPRTSFGVGTIVQGRGKHLGIFCWPEQCVPNLAHFRENGEVKLHELKGTSEVTKSWQREFKVSPTLWRMLGIGIEKAHRVVIRMQSPSIEEVSIATLNLMFAFKQLSPAALEALTNKNEPRNELVFRALKCERLECEFLDKTGVSLHPPDLVSAKQQAEKNQKDEKKTANPDELSFKLNNEGKIVIPGPVWVAFRSAFFEKETAKIARGVQPIEGWASFQEAKIRNNLIGFRDLSGSPAVAK